MAVDLHTDKHGQDIIPPLLDRNHSNTKGSSALNPQLLISHDFGSHTRPLRQGDDFIAHLTHHMPHSMLQDHEKIDLSSIGSDSLESSWSPNSTLWSPLGSNQRSPEGSSQEPSPSPPATPGNIHDSCWENTYDVVGMFEKMKLDERGNCNYHPGYGTHSFNNTSNVRLCSYQPLVQEQTRAIQLSRLKQEQILSLEQKLTAYRESHGQIHEPSEQVLQFQNNGKRVVGVGSGNGRRIRPTWPGPQRQHAGSELRALLLDGSGSRGASSGTGVFLPRGGTTGPSESHSKRPGKGCSTVLIPARVVQALQLHFDQMAAMSGTKAAGFPPLHDVLVSDRDGMYSLQKRQSRKATANIHNEMILPQEWTY